MNSQYLWSLRFFDAAAIFYLVSAFLSLIFIAVRSLSLAKISRLLVSAGWILHTIALLLRWHAGGIEHPPWSNLYESIVFFIWGMLLIYQIIQYRNFVPMLGSFILPLAIIGLGIASFGTDKEITPLVPALRSKWIFIHVFMACIAYPCFLVGSVLSLFYLMKDRVHSDYFGAFVSLIASIALLSTVDHQFWLASALYLTSFLFYSLSIKKNAKKPLFFRYSRRFAKGLFVCAVLTHLLGVIQLALGWGRIWLTSVSFRSHPFQFGIIIAALAMVLLYLLYDSFEERFVRLLPNKEILDGLAWRVNLFGLPMVTLLLVTGGIWAHSAWGRFWGWDPKETWALITWIVYAIYVHSRIVHGWSGRRSAIISIIGFFVVMFTYMGVNVLLSGLHSYGNPNPG
jgi:cytochrome c-type biogenesis protein CcsB